MKEEKKIFHLVKSKFFFLFWGCLYDKILREEAKIEINKTDKGIR